MLEKYKQMMYKQNLVSDAVASYDKAHNKDPYNLAMKDVEIVCTPQQRDAIGEAIASAVEQQLNKEIQDYLK